MKKTLLLVIIVTLLGAVGLYRYVETPEAPVLGAAPRVLTISQGGTGGSTSSSARTNLGIDDIVAVTYPISIANGGTGTTTASAARVELGLEIGTDVQAQSSELQGIIDASVANDAFAYKNSGGTWASTAISAFGRSLVDDADAATSRSTMGLGTVATYATGTSGATVPLLNDVAGRTWVGSNTFTSSTGFTDAAVFNDILTVDLNATFYDSVGVRDAGTSPQEALELEDATDIFAAVYTGSGNLAGIKMAERVDGQFGIAMYHDGAANSLRWQSMLSSGGALDGTILMQLGRSSGDLFITGDLDPSGSIADTNDSRGVTGQVLAASGGTALLWQYMGTVTSTITDNTNFSGLGTTTTLPGAAVRNTSVITYETTVRAGTSSGALSLRINGVARCNMPHATDEFVHHFTVKVLVDSAGNAEGYCDISVGDDSTAYFHSDEAFSVTLNTGSDNTFNVNSSVANADHLNSYITVE